MKKVISMLLVFALVLSMSVPVFAAKIDCDHSFSSKTIKFISYGKNRTCEEDGYASVYRCNLCGIYLHNVSGKTMQESNSATPIVIPSRGGHAWEYEEIPTTGTHTKSCANCTEELVEDCVGCWETGCELCESEMIGLHPDHDENHHCDGCDGALDHEPEWKHNDDQHWSVCPYDAERIVTENEDHDWMYEEIPTTGTHTKKCRICGLNFVQDCTGCWETGCDICGSELLGIHPDHDGNAHCDGCDAALDHEPEWKHDDNQHWSVCPHDEERVVTDKEDHEWIYEEIPTTGTHTKKCRVCGFNFVEDCKGCWETGCADCGSKLIGIHPDRDGDCHCDGCDGALDHDPEWKHDDEQHWSVCPHDEDRVVTDKEDHDWMYEEIPTTGTHNKECRVCGFSVVENCEGCWETGCEDCGSKLIGIHPDRDGDYHCDGCDGALDHDAEWKHDDKQHWQVCPHNKDKIMSEKADHVWAEWEVTKEATEDEKGEKVRVCIYCGKNEVGEIDKLEHKHVYTHLSRVVEPTCKEKGYTENFCKCGDSEKVDYVDVVDHTWGDWVITKEATEIAEGEKTRECSVCHDTEDAKIDKIPHDCKKADKLEGEKEPTCAEEGYTGDEVCGICGEVLKHGTTIPALGHDGKVVKYVGKKDAECRKDGYTGDAVCPDCGEVLKKGKAIPKLGHDYDKDGICKRCKHDAKSPETGDETMILPFIALMAVSLCGVVAIVIPRKKRI